MVTRGEGKDGDGGTANTDASATRLTIASFIEAVRRIAMRRVDDDFVSLRLKANGGVNHQSLRAPDAQIGVEEDHGRGAHHDLGDT